MGMERTIRFPSGPVPAWEEVRRHLDRLDSPATVKMIDGMPAFPDEAPPAGWREVRVGGAAGMVTVRSGPATLACVVWGNADASLIHFWAGVCWACAAAGGGVIDAPDAPHTAESFARAAGLRPG